MKPSPGNYGKTILKLLQTGWRRRRPVHLFVAAVFVLASLTLLLNLPQDQAQTKQSTDTLATQDKNKNKHKEEPMEASKPKNTPIATSDRPSPDSSQLQPAAPVPAQPASTPLLFGIGPQADGALAQRLTAETPIKMLTSWYNSPNDLGFMRGWQDDRIPNAYAAGYSLHLIVWTDKPEGELTTKYGPACGRSYPFSSSFESDMRELATIWNGSGPLYVSMFSELQTFPCQDNTWKGNENYYRALMDQYRLAQSIFKAHAPNSQVSLTWGGWQARWDDPGNGSGRSLIPHFADVLNNSDFQSFQAMDSSSNVADISDMTKILHGYGGGRVMVAHYKPDNGNQATWNNDLQQVFTPGNVAALRNDGLFAFSFMDGVNMNANEASYQQAKDIVLTYGR